MNKRQEKEKRARRRVAPVRPGEPRPRSPLRAAISRPRVGAGVDSPPPYAPDAARRSSRRCRRRVRRPQCAPPGTPGGEILLELADAVKVGVTTDELEPHLPRGVRPRGGYPSPLHYKGFPKVAVHFGQRG